MAVINMRVHMCFPVIVCFLQINNLMQRDDSLEKILLLGKIEDKRRRGQQRMRWLDSVTLSMSMTLSKFQEIVKDRGVQHVAIHGAVKSWT